MLTNLTDQSESQDIYGSDFFIGQLGCVDTAGSLGNNYHVTLT